MSRVFCYPWALGADPAAALTDLSAAGVDGVALASHYHSIRTLDPRVEGDGFVSYPGGCFFDPGEAFDGLDIDPPVNAVDGERESVGRVADAAAATDVDLTAWTVCLHNTRLGARNPEYRVESAFGHAHDHALCPSNPEVRAYFAAVADALASRGVDRIGLESVGFPSAFHGHGVAFGHDKNQALASPAEEWLYSQCFCDACRAAADFDVEAAAARIRDHCDRALSTPEPTVSSLATLVEEDDLLRELFAFRADVVTSLVAAIDAASDGVDLTYYASAGFGRGPTDGWPAGVRLSALADHLDRVAALCYTGDPVVARERVAAFREFDDLTVDAAVSLDPDLVATREAFAELTEAVTGALDGELLVYNDSLLTDEHRTWVADLADD